MNAVEHYSTLGATEGRDPHASFNTRYYARQCGAGVNPLEHYVETGTDPRFKTSFYAKFNPGIRTNPLVHYVLAGKAKGLRLHPDFPANFPSHWIDLAPVA
jgi:hypothetical protein